jgi:hypothetical protein
MPSSSERRSADLPPNAVADILSYLSLPADTTLSPSPLAFLRDHFPSMPPTLLNHFAGVTTARDRASIPEIKARRLVWATGGNAKTGLGMAPRRVERAPINEEAKPRSISTRPPEMQWNEGRKRWPGLWERLGGPTDPADLEDLVASHGQPHTASDDDATHDSDDETFAMRSFLPTHETVHHPSPLVVGPSSRSGMNTTMDRKRFGAFLRSLEEEEEAMDAVDARRREREFDRAETAKKEEFEDSDEEDEANGVRTGNGTPSAGADVSEVIETFERRLLELFIDGLDVSASLSDWFKPSQADENPSLLLLQPVPR